MSSRHSTTHAFLPRVQTKRPWEPSFASRATEALQRLSLLESSITYWLAVRREEGQVLLAEEALIREEEHARKMCLPKELPHKDGVCIPSLVHARQQRYAAAHVVGHKHANLRLTELLEPVPLLAKRVGAGARAYHVAVCGHLARA